MSDLDSALNWIMPGNEASETTLKHGNHNQATHGQRGGAGDSDAGGSGAGSGGAGGGKLTQSWNDAPAHMGAGAVRATTTHAGGMLRKTAAVQPDKNGTWKVVAQNTMNMRSGPIDQVKTHSGFKDKPSAQRAADSWLADNFSYTINELMPGATSLR